VEHLVALWPVGERSLLGCVVRRLDEYRYRVRVGQVRREEDLELVGEEIQLYLTEDTEILWIGDDVMDVGTWLLVPLAQSASLKPDDVIAPTTITLQNGTGETIRPYRE
jgi:hypothetical protein